DGRRRTGPRRLRARDLRGVGCLSALPALRRCAGRAGGAEAARSAGGHHLEFPSLPRIVSIALRAAGFDQRHRVLVGPRHDEAAREHLSRRPAAGRRPAGAGSDGRRQRPPGCRRRSQGRHARGPAAAIWGRAGPRARARRAGHHIAARAPGAAVIAYRDLTTLEEYAQVVELERDIWGPGYDEVVPVPILAVAVLRGGVLIGAFAGERDERLVGFVYSLPGIKHGRPTQWSHMLGVVEQYRNDGLGHRLKLLQRDRALAMGLDLIEWTFDPMQALNAHLNFAKLGVVVEEYEV